MAAITVDHAILQLSGKTDEPTTTRLAVKPLNFPADAKLVYAWKQVQDEMLPGAAKMSEKAIRFNNTDQSAVEATFPDSGVYEIQVTVTDSAHHLSVTRNTWVNVWDSKPALQVNGKPDPLTVIPGMNPPRVRNVEPEPGPFVHPRLFCSQEDWAEIHARAVQGGSKIAGIAWTRLSDRYKKGIDPNGPHGKFLAELETYVDKGYQGAFPDLTMGSNDPKKIENNLNGLLDNLANASFFYWMRVDPAKPLDSLEPADREMRLKLAKQVAGVSRVLLENSWNRTTGEFKTTNPGYISNLDKLGESTPDCYANLALAYDFSAPWMTEQQLRDTRDFLIAVGRGRAGPGMDLGRCPPRNKLARRGWAQNGTFAVWGEAKVMLSLVVSGEESGADPVVVNTFLNPPKPANYEKRQEVSAYDLVKPVDVDGGGPHAWSRAYSPAITWPHALKSEVGWLQKEIFTFQDGMISPWGFTLERLAYVGFMTNEAWPRAYIFARFGGFNQFVGSYFYQSVNNWIYTMYPSSNVDQSPSFSSNVGIYDHHTGGGDYRQQFILFLKHMYPDDPAVEYAYAAQAPFLEKRSTNPMLSCLFGVDPKTSNPDGTLEPMARASRLPLTKLDPKLGIAVMRSDWKEEGLMAYFNGGDPIWGHMNAEHGSFSLFAMGRHWSVPSGYHKVLGNFQSLIQVQNPAWAACPMTEGYMTENPCFKPDVPGCDYQESFPTPSAKMLEVREAPNQSWSLTAIDMTTSYNYYCLRNPQGKTPVEFDLAPYQYPGLKAYWESIDPDYIKPSKGSFYPVPEACKIERSIRTLLFVRGRHPYVLVVDDFQKNARPANYRWTMNDKTKMKDEGRAADKNDESFCVQLAPGATSTEGVLLNQWDKETQPGQTGLPRLLVRDVSTNDNSRQPVLRMQQTVFKLPEEKYSREETNALVIERNQVVDPRFKVLLFPFRTGEKLPVTKWNDKKTELTVDLQDGNVDTIQFDRSNPDHRTRLSMRKTTSGTQ